MNRSLLIAPSLLFIFAVSTVSLATTPQPSRCDSLFREEKKAETKNATKPAARPSQSDTQYAETALTFLRVLEVHSDQILKHLSERPNTLRPEQMAQLRTLAQLSQQYQNTIAPLFRSLNENAQLRVGEDSTEMRELIDQEQAALQSQINQGLLGLRGHFVDLLQPSGNVALLEVGPSRAGSFNEYDLKNLIRMYQKYADKKGWTVSVMEENYVENALRNVTLKVEGRDAYRLLSFDRGDHRFIELGDRSSAATRASSASASSGKRYTRYALVKVYRPPEPREFRVSVEDFTFTATRSSGPGGQHVNKTDSAVHAVHRASGLAVKVSSERSQADNKRIAIELLTARLFSAHVHDQEAEIRGSRAEGRVNHFVEAQAARWTRTYDSSVDSTQVEKLFAGELDGALLPFQAAALEAQMRDFTRQFETGRVEFLR